MNIIISFLGTTLLTIAQLRSWMKISDSKNNKLNKFDYLKILLLVVAIFVNHYFGMHSLRGIFTVIIAIVFCKIIVESNIRKAILLVFVSHLIIIVSESILAILFVAIFKLNTEAFDSQIISLIFDILMTILVIVIAQLKICQKFYLLLIKLTDYLKVKHILVLILFVAIGTNVFSIPIYFKTNMMFALTFNILVSIIYTVIILLIFRYQYKYYQTNLQYNNSLESLRLQEQVINNLKIYNHENKNQLLTIKEMTKNKKIREYIDILINKKKNNNNEIINLILHLPSGGIRGLIYSKLLEMQEKGIAYHLNIDKKLSNEILHQIDSNDMVDICNILGVFIDNAIDESEKHLDKPITINLYKSDNKLVISVANYFENNDLNLDKINLKTTKGEGHGYGLQLVKKIIVRNIRLSNELILGKNIFKQQLIISI